MSKKFTRALAVLLVFVMLGMMFPISSLAQSGDESANAAEITLTDETLTDESSSAEETIPADGEEPAPEEIETEPEEEISEEESEATEEDVEAVAEESDDEPAALSDEAAQEQQQSSGEVPIYRLLNPKTGEHLFTSDVNEKNTLYEKSGWGYEGIAWYAPAEGDAVYRLYSVKKSYHLLTTNIFELRSLVAQSAWKQEGTTAFCSGGTIPVYRIYDPKTGIHHWTTDANEYNTLAKNGWKQEGVGMYAAKLGSTHAAQYKEVAKPSVQSLAVYRIYNPTTGEHLFSTDANEKNTLYNNGWGYEGIAWYSANTGTAIYRLFNPKTSEHLYTSDMNEVSVLTSQRGWKRDGTKPIFYSYGDIPVYRLFNSKTGMHHWTTDANEYRTLPKTGWKQEGVAFYAYQKGATQAAQYKVQPANFAFAAPEADCICISISTQTMAVFKNGKMTMKTDIVTGNKGTYDTPTGNYVIYEKSRNVTLMPYGAFVNFWMPFYLDYGIHDANGWRSQYGGNIYNGNGSHGCVNTPYQNAKYIWDNCPVGTRVYIRA